MKKNILYLMSFLCLVASCIYPFQPEYPESDGKIVIEGDILIGEETSVTLSYLANLDGSAFKGSEPPSGRVWVESSDGETYEGVIKGRGLYVIDTRTASPDKKYRLCFQCTTPTVKNYCSEWLDVAESGSIDSLYVGLDEPLSMVRFYMDMHNEGPNRYYRITFKEDWEYHSQFYTELKYIPPANRTLGFGEIVTDESINYYYCWNKGGSSSIMLTNTENLSSNAIKGYEYYSLPRTDRRISYVYSEEVHINALTKDAYDYWNNINNCSNNTGSLFSPMPSDMVGNIRCVTDSTEHVIGYISAVKRATKRMFYYHNISHYYINDLEEMPVHDTLPEKDWYTYYMSGYVPIRYDDELMGYSWAPVRCVDCRKEGGTKEKPSWWPTLDL